MIKHLFTGSNGIVWPDKKLLRGIMRKYHWGLTIAAILTANVSFAMDAETFYRKGLVLQRQGVVAITSSDLEPLMSEIKVASKSLKLENDRAKLAGKPLFCPPTSNQMTADQLLAEFGRIPANRRKLMTVRQALREIAIRKYPCRS
jgi:hypothetical protein